MFNISATVMEFVLSHVGSKPLLTGSFPPEGGFTTLSQSSTYLEAVASLES